MRVAGVGGVERSVQTLMLRPSVGMGLLEKCIGPFIEPAP